jgi:hypothetical protein
VFGLGQRGDVRLDVRIDAVVDERHASRVTDEPKGVSFCDAGVHGGVPFYGQAEPELRLCPKGATVRAHVARTRTMHRLEGAAECLGRAVPVTHRDPQQFAVAQYLGSCDGHPSPPHVLGQRDAGERREHPSRVVLRGAERRGRGRDVEFLGEMLLDEVDEPVEHCDHRFPFRSQPADPVAVTPDFRGPIQSPAPPATPPLGAELAIRRG